MRNNSKAKLAVEDGDIAFHKPENRLWRLGCILLAFLCLILLITIIAVSVKKENTSISSTEYVTSESQICNEPHCVKIAATLLENMNPTINPCDNFFDFACGGWARKNVIPEDRFRYSAFVVLRDQVQIILKDLLERENQPNEIDALIKVRDFYKSCNDFGIKQPCSLGEANVNGRRALQHILFQDSSLRRHDERIPIETIEKRDAEPLIQLLTKLGGWPVLSNHTGGNWDQTKYNLEELMGTLSGTYNNDIIVTSYVNEDDKNSSRHIIKVDQVDQTSLGMPSFKYFLREEFEHYKSAYYQHMVTIAIMLGADESIAIRDMTDVLEFETRLANLSVPDEQRRDNEKLYNPTTLTQLQQDVPQINWSKYFSLILPDEYQPLPDTEPIINRSPEFVKRVATFVVEETPPRVVANYLIWRITMNRITNLSRRFRDAQLDFNSVLLGTTNVPARWRFCVEYANDAMMFATGRLYVPQQFGGDSKKNTERMIANLKKAFKDMLAYNSWMDTNTKVVAAEKCDAMDVEIGYPDWIMNDTMLNERYQKLEIRSDTYFENILDYINWLSWRNWRNLRRPVDRDEWQCGPAVVNAYYSSSRNQIVFPAGILQPPFYHSDSPWYLNYGGIGMVIGHEITHGFDDRGRQYDKNGNLQQWWSDESVDNFKERAQCMVNQYGKYVMPENNKTLNGIQTQGENIADNGGLAQSFKAYMDNDQTPIKLPGLTNYTSEQLFFLNFAQVWCSAFRPEGVDSTILSGVHSPGRYRIIGPAHNSEEFANAFKCHSSSFMNPSTQEKCKVW